MLVLSRKKGQRIRISDTVTVTVLGVRGGNVQLGIEAPPSVPIHREEVHRRIVSERKPTRKLTAC